MLALVLLFTHAAAASAGPSPLEPGFHLTQNGGFCSPGVFEQTKPAPGQPLGLKQWGSFCKDGDKATGSAETSPFKAGQAIGLYLAGYVSTPGLSLEIENLAKGARLRIVPSSFAGEEWIRYEIRMPETWRGDPVRLIARDDATDLRGWFAFTEPVTSIGMPAGIGEASELLLRTALYFTLMILPALAAGALAIRKGLRDLVLIGLVELAGIGAAGYLAFWLWFVAPKSAHILTFFFPVLCGIAFAWNYRRLDTPGRQTVKHLLTPLMLTGAASLLVVSTGFVYGGLDEPFQIAAKRFSHVLPPDNTIPYLFAQALRRGYVPKPLQADWLSSDRPPLQTGLVLYQYSYLTGQKKLAYTVESVVLQSFWIFAVWLLLTAFEVDKYSIALALAVSLFSGFVFLNSFFVWPKLLATAYTLGMFSILLTPRYALLRNNRAACMLTGAMLAFAMLSHGGSAFAVIGAVLTMAIFRRHVPIKSLALTIITAFVIYSPWLLYQKLYDPPANRLLKMHLAGVEEVDPRGLGETLITAYRSLTPQRILANKKANVERLSQNSGRFWIETAHLLRYARDPVIPAQIAAVLRGWMFFFFLTSLGFLIVGPVALLKGIQRRFRTKEWRAASIMWIFVAVTALAWCALMFGPGTTVIHQGTYAIVLLGYVGSLLALWAVSRALAVVIGCLQVLLNVLLYVVFMAPAAPGALLAKAPPLLGCLILCALSLACICWLLARLWRMPASRGIGAGMYQELAIALRPGDRALD